MVPEEIILKYYTPGTPLLRTLLTHSRAVAAKAEAVGRNCGLDIDLDFVHEAAMLHDIGIIRCHAPSIYCEGESPYICHGIEGARMLRECGLPEHALVCERHTGAGLSIEDIIAQDLPLPHRDMCPQTLEEKLVCYADKFFSKSLDKLEQEKSPERVKSEMARHGEDTLRRFLDLHKLFTGEDI